jgi:hypothetical protein
MLFDLPKYIYTSTPYRQSGTSRPLRRPLRDSRTINCPFCLAVAGALLRCQSLAVNGTAARLTPCIASSHDRQNGQFIIREPLSPVNLRQEKIEFQLA